MWTPLKALPPYLGGKRKLLGHIFKYLSKPSEAPTFVDAFLGGGSVSLMAKAKGYRVICNDIAWRSYIVGKALIENSHIKLDDFDITRLFLPAGDRSDFISSNFSPDVLPLKNAEFLDNAMSVVNQIKDTKHWLLLLILIKYIIGLRPVGNFGAKAIVHQIVKQQWEDINPKFIKSAAVYNICNHPRTVLSKLLKQINRGVFDNGHTNKIYKQDVFAFLEQLDRGDIIYLDPPYGGTKTYEGSLKELDSILLGKIFKPNKSVFSSINAIEYLEKLFIAAKRFPIWVISYGNAQISLPSLTNLVSKFKQDVIGEEFRYTHLTGLSTDEHNAQNREYLIYARGDK